MRKHPSHADEELAAACRRRGLKVSARVVQSMKERGALRPPPSKVDDYPKGTEKIVDALVRNGWQRSAKQATFLTFMDGHPFTAKGVRWAIGTPSNIFPPVVFATGKSEDEVEQARERQADGLADNVIKSRHPKQVALRKMLRARGVDPSVAANDLAMALSGDPPPVEVERYEPTVNKFIPEPAPWMMRLLGRDAVLEEWARDPQTMSIDIQELYWRLGDPRLGECLDDALEQAAEEQMAAAREGVRQFLGDIPHFAGADHVYGIAGAFLFGLADVVGTLDRPP